MGSRRSLRELGAPQLLVSTSRPGPGSELRLSQERIGEPAGRPLNRILAALPPAEYHALAVDLEDIPLVPQDVFYEAAGEIRHVYFPQHGVVSLVTLLEDGVSVEAATIGSEGVVGVGAFMDYP